MAELKLKGSSVRIITPALLYTLALYFLVHGILLVQVYPPDRNRIVSLQVVEN
jgi:hypothetical protein